MAMMQYFTAFGPQIERLRRESGTVSAIAGILKAPMDIIADKLRGYLGLCMDLVNQPDKVLAAWNGMMISALARGYQVTGEPDSGGTT